MMTAQLHTDAASNSSNTPLTTGSALRKSLTTEREAAGSFTRDLCNSFDEPEPCGVWRHGDQQDERVIVANSWRAPPRQKRCVNPAKNVRRRPNCGAKTPSPVPLRIW